MTLAFGVDQAVSVATEAVHVTVAVRNAAIRKQNGDLVQRFGRMRPEIPHHLRTFQVALRQTLLGVNEVRKLQRIADEEHWRVVANDVPVAFLGVELQGETTRIALGVGRTTLATYGRKAQKGWRLFAYRFEQLGTGVFSDITGDGERTVGA